MEVKRKAGQPKKDERKIMKRRQQVRYNDDEWNQVTECAKSAGLTISDFIRGRTLVK